jgi:GT2 family glycosyltransferase
MKLAIIIPSYNNQIYLQSCIDSISRITAIDPLIVVADDASPNPDVQNFLDRMDGPHQIHVMRNQENLGFGRTTNKAFSYLGKRYPDISFYLILNQDTELTDTNISPMLSWMSRHPKVGICGPRLLNTDGSIQNSFYSYPSITKKCFQIAGLKKWAAGKPRVKFQAAAKYLPGFARLYLKNFEEIDHPIDVPWITGASLFINPRMLNDVSGFDENYKMYAEDMDLCLRAHKSHWRVCYYPGLEVVHHGGLKPSLRSPYLVKLYFDSMRYFYNQHYQGFRKTALLYLNRIEKSLELKRVRKQK